MKAVPTAVSIQDPRAVKSPRRSAPGGALLLSLGLVLSAPAFLVPLARPVAAQDAGTVFQGVITSQLDAFRMDDWDRAFGYAAPFIQDVFRTPDAFGAMVRGGYPMVWRPADVEFLELHEKDGSVWQKVKIRDAEGRVHILDYQMVDTPEGLRIGAVEILRRADVGA